MVRFANQEARRFEREFAPWARDRAVATLRGLSKSQRLAVITGHHSEMEQLNASFLSERGMRDISAFPEHVFVHTFPTDGIGRANTADNNEEIDTRNLSTHAAVEAILSKELTLSCSAIAKTGPNPGPDILFRVVNGRDVSCFGTSRRQKDYARTMYPFGIVLDEGCVLSAYRNDAGTLQEKGRPHRKSKYDRGTKLTAIQPDPAEAIPHALENFTRFSTYENNAGLRMGRDINEFVVSGVNASKFYINMDDPWLMGSGPHDSPCYGEDPKKHLSTMLTVFNQFPEMGLLVTHHGQTKSMVMKDGEWTDPASGLGIGAMHEADIRASREAVVSFPQVSFDVVQTHMWASGDMPAESELNFLSVKGNPNPEHLLTADSSGKTALFKAVEAGKARHIPEDFLSQNLSMQSSDTPGVTLADVLARHKRPLAEEALDEARIQMTKVAPFPDGPKPLTGELSGLWAVGTTLDGGWFCTDSRGSSLNTPAWHLSKSEVNALTAPTVAPQSYQSPEIPTVVAQETQLIAERGPASLKADSQLTRPSAKRGSLWARMLGRVSGLSTPIEQDSDAAGLKGRTQVSERGARSGAAIGKA